MKTQMTQQAAIGVCLLLVVLTLVLAGCGSHDQSTAGGGTMTSDQIKQNAQRQNQPSNTPPSAPAPR